MPRTAWNSDWQRLLLRRSFLSGTAAGLGAIAAASMLTSEARGGGVTGLSPGVTGPHAPPHFPPRVRRVIFLYMAGGPSHLETFDYKPELDRLDGQSMPASFTQGQPIAQLQGQALRIQGHLTRFRQCGEAGAWISDFLPHHRRIVDQIAIIRSMVTEQINHDPAHTFMNTGTAISGRPSMGAWIQYGLGSESDALPGFVVMTSVGGRNPQPIAMRQWSAGFLPSRFQGVEFNSAGEPVHYVANPPGVSRPLQSRVIETVRQLEEERNEVWQNPEVAARISAYELAFKMQVSVPELVDMSDEPQYVWDMYGAQPGDGSFASNCVLARRMAERGVRFIQLYHRGWDHHGDLVKHMHTCCGLTDRPVAALLQDLQWRGMLDETLVVWGGEFGRTPMFQGKGGPGRDHHIKGFSMWMAGGGVRRGCVYGETDELGYHAVVDPVHVRDLHATILHQLGIDHRRLSFQYQGLDMRLTGVEPARVIGGILA
ncbi:MAG: DUF1501 domain-containing protein [Planctomycetota bacterium]|nr:MAG: DUF1501 domain-containing protein [Planctomycetota bacterium]